MAPAKAGLDLIFLQNRATSKESRAGQSVKAFPPKPIPL
jgi:hypothetical protein